MDCIIRLDDNTEIQGEVFGDIKSVEGPLSFQFGVSGYQEAITNPINDHTILLFTYPSIGNAGINIEDSESLNARVKAVIVNEIAEIPSNWRSIMSFEEFCKKRGVVGVKGIDTRALLRKIERDNIKSASIVVESKDIVELKKNNRTRTRYQMYGSGSRITVLDLGVSQSVLKELSLRNCYVSVIPYDSSVKTILNTYPDGVIVSQGQEIEEHVVSVLEKLQGQVPILGLGMGAVCLAKAFNVKTIDNNHVGGSHGVRDNVLQISFMTSQNHSVGVDAQSLIDHDFTITHTEVNDNSVEGFRHRFNPSLGVLFEPQGSPGSMDAVHIFDAFCELVEGHKEANHENN